MVQHQRGRGTSIPPRDFFPAPSTREVPSWASERPFDRAAFGNNHLNDPPRFESHPAHPRYLSIEQALRCCVGIQNFQFFGLWVMDANGERRQYTSQHLTPHQPGFYNDSFWDNVHTAVRQVKSDPSYSAAALNHDMENESTGREDRKQSTSDDSCSGERRQRRLVRRGSDGEDSGSASRKRLRARFSGYDEEASSEQTTPTIRTIKTQSLCIGDDAEVASFYKTRFKDMQQAACKVIGKIFVKLVEPKKQTHYPYTKGAEKCPPWWPAVQGEGAVRHKEPDHLYKSERVILLIHILLMIVEPREKQIPSVQKLGLNVRKLEEVTMETTSNWFSDKDHPSNAQKKQFLKEIFKVAKQQERYKNGEIDATCRVSVSCHDGVLAGSEDDGDDGDEGDTATVAVATPDSLVSPSSSLMYNIQPAPHMMEDSRPPGDASRDWKQLPMRQYAQQQNFVEPKMEEGHPSTFQNEAFRPKWEMTTPSPFPHPDPAHHAQQYQPQTQNMYGWQSNNMSMLNTSNGPLPQPFYTTSPHSAGSGGYQLPPPLPMPQQPMLPPLVGTSGHAGFDGSRYDTSPATMGPQLRTGSLAHPFNTGRQQPHQGGYQDFLDENGVPAYGNAEDPLKGEHHDMQSQ